MEFIRACDTDILLYRYPFYSHPARADRAYLHGYIDNFGDLRGTLTHSFEGTSYYLYRAFKKNLSAKQIENFKNKILEGSLTQKDISTYTERIGPYIKNIMTSRCNNDII